MSIFHVEVIMGTENIARDHRCELAPMLLSITSVHHINHSFGVAVTKVTIMRRAKMDLKSKV